MKQSIARNENAIQEAKEAAKKPLELKRQASCIVDLVERVLLLALRKGEFLRFPSRVKNSADFWEDFKLNMGMVIENMDEAGIPWSVQNEALCYVNDADTSRVWIELHSKQLKRIAERICHSQS